MPRTFGVPPAQRTRAIVPGVLEVALAAGSKARDVRPPPEPTAGRSGSGRRPARRVVVAQPIRPAEATPPSARARRVDPRTSRRWSLIGLGPSTSAPVSGEAGLPVIPGLDCFSDSGTASSLSARGVIHRHRCRSEPLLGRSTSATGILQYRTGLPDSAPLVRPREALGSPTCHGRRQKSRVAASRSEPSTPASRSDG